MAIGSSTSNIQSATQGAWQQLRLQQAKRDADRADQTAQALQAQAEDAQRVANRAEAEAKSLGVQADQAQSEATRARQGLASLSSMGQMQTLLNHVTEQVFQVPQNTQQSTQLSVPVKSQTGATPVVNTQGQVTGTVVNTTA
ncbi:MAG: hypothetical protein NT159_11660 [Proteobacteria bacterium]|nr:hypothetical protein [Pseudomonadota bacterium]